MEAFPSGAKSGWIQGAMSNDPEIQHAARFLLQKYGAEAEAAVARCADAFEVNGETGGSLFAKRVLKAIIELRRAAIRRYHAARTHG